MLPHRLMCVPVAVQLVATCYAQLLYYPRDAMLCVAVLAMALCPSVRPSQVGVLLKRLNLGSHRQHHTIAQGPYLSDAKDLR